MIRLVAARRPTTVRDVALAAGVSPKTVSNVVNGYARVTPETRERVQRQIDALGYRPQAAGRQLRQGRTGMVTLAVPGIEMPYFAELSSQVVRAARRHGLTVVVEQTDADLEREREVAAGLPTRFADGLVFSPLEMPPEELVSVPHTPLVLLGEHAVGVEADRVSIDGVAVGTEGTEHLVATGRRCVAALGLKPTLHDTASQRLRGYRAALAAAGLPCGDELLLRVEDWTREDGEAAADRLVALRRDGVPVDGVLAMNDVLAMGLLRGLRRHGVRVPEDVAVVGIDDVPESAYCTPTLTTVALDRAAVAEAALRLLVERLADPDLPPREVVAPHRLVVRESSAPPAAR
ncbi:LacI family DNA-binding transcriptional regulator [Pseudokineococcus marinus]|uniref:LacI family DNA-binding transcriptional regulator n=1 Tax=Pseudokineococcus marinus TaxID=351215 RepID=A0A849BLG9_9ACTN|nr:LacI family DNA-binding transcriptional regulator [Pseudokineococcus marinus]